LSQKPGWALHCIESGVPTEGSEESRLIFICFGLVLGAGCWVLCWTVGGMRLLAWPGLLSRESRVPVADSARRTVCGSGEGGVQGLREGEAEGTREGGETASGGEVVQGQPKFAVGI